MQTFTLPRVLVAGLVGGLLGAALNAAVLALMDFQMNAVAQISYQDLLQRLGYGAGWGVLLAAAHPFLPKAFGAHAAIAAVLTAALELGLFFQLKGVPYEAGSVIRTVIASAVYGVAAVFVIHQVLDLALPDRNMGRRAEEFQDDPAGA